jgi:hypothetical protein
MFSLTSKKWYAAEMFGKAGASGSPHVSPIFVRKIKVLKSREGLLEVEFLATLGFGCFALDQFQLGGAGLFSDAKFVGRPGFDDAFMAQGAEEVVEEGLRFALLVSL